MPLRRSGSLLLPPRPPVTASTTEPGAPLSVVLTDEDEAAERLFGDGRRVAGAGRFEFAGLGVGADAPRRDAVGDEDTAAGDVDDPGHVVLLGGLVGGVAHV